jgi:MFS family permease
MTTATDGEHSMRKWRSLTLLALAELMAMGLWFSGSAVVPQLSAEWGLSGSGQSWMTMSVQLGFVVGAILSAVLNLADRLSLQRLIAISALIGAAANAAIPLLDLGAGSALALRFVTGAALAGVYPPGMKMVATWTTRDRGLAIGFLIGALAIGSALPHLLNAVSLFGPDGMPPWRTVLLASSAIAAIGAVIVGVAVETGSNLAKASAFSWRHAGGGLADPPTRFANFGYLGHMWELYAMWTWAPVFVLASYERAGWSIEHARLVGFAIIAAGAFGSLVAGILADRIGRTVVAAASLLISGSCCLVVGFSFDDPALLTVICLVWGFAVVADSAQFSAAVSELADARYVGTALTVQTSLGFLLTMITIHAVPPLVELVGWRYVFVPLAAGPVFGIWSMVRLRRRPEAVRMASGNR